MVEFDDEGHKPLSKRVFVERKSLRSHVHRQGLQSLFEQSSLCEPTFKHLIVLFRYSSVRRDVFAAVNRERGVHIKSFKDVPFADLEVPVPNRLYD